MNANQPIGQRVAEVMSTMTLDQEDFLVEGHGTANEPPTSGGNPYVFWMPGITLSCGSIPALGEEDGPAGVADGLSGVTQLPAGVGLAATFDPSLASQYGQVIGSEEWGKGAAVNLGPTINIDRDPRWGRSFETFTEDPFLNASLATNEIDGVQSTGEMSQVKHFAAYNQETNRNTPADNVIIDQRTLNEIYFPAFQAAVQQSKAGSVMCSYAVVNGDFACQSPFLMNQTLDQEWGYPGFVTSDYGALHDTIGGALGGLDQEQPFNTYFGPTLNPPALEADVENGTIPRAVINTMVQRILTEMFRFNLFTSPPTGNPFSTVTSTANQAVGNDVAETSATLLKNASHALPLPAKNAGYVAVIGPAASTQPIYGGGGSAYVNPSQTVTPLAGILATAGSGSFIHYQPGLPTDASLAAIPSADLSPAFQPITSFNNFGQVYTGTLTAPESGTYVLAITNDCGCYTPEYLTLDGKQLISDPSTPPVHTYSVAVNLTQGEQYTLSVGGALISSLTWAKPSDLASSMAPAIAAAKLAKTAVVVVSDDTESEATDRLSLNLPSAQDELISAVAAVNPNTVVVVDAGAPIAMPWLDQVNSVLDAWYPGQSNGTALADVLFGKSDPSGHLPVTFPTGLSEVPASTTAQFPGMNNEVQYSEGIDVGYRWYDSQHLTPMFPFGFGLSYTRFAFSGLRVDRSTVDGVHDVHVSATVTNVGKSAGADVAQLYLGDPASTGEPPRQLVGFQRVKLGPGQSARVQFTITPRDASWWDDGAGGWTEQRGLYRVYVGDSSALANLPLRNAFEVTQTPGGRQVAVTSPSTMTPGKPARVTVTLTAGGDETLQNVRLALQLPDGWTARHGGQKVLPVVKPRRAVAVTFVVTPPSWAPSTNSVVHATADLGPDAQREAGTTVTVS
ncbi:MAG TPA: glycoside hydrolase family 3 C-terminal domain-containing protein [Solirubrobacteraceae bacterium]|nr:glycoside hydrolase family 3 C-terminal domain-containing protein [Solirubrobacteraceae bacterium]